MSARKPNQRGMTLVELLIAITILVVVATTAMALMTAVSTSYRVSMDRLEAERSTRSALLHITKALHQFNPATDGQISISANATSSILTLGTKHTYTLSEGTLTDTMAGVTSTLATKVTVFDCVLTDSNRRIQLTIDTDHSSEITTVIRLVNGSV